MSEGTIIYEEAGGPVAGAGGGAGLVEALLIHAVWENGVPGLRWEPIRELVAGADAELTAARVRLAEQATEIERQSTALARIAYGPLGYPADAMRAQDALNPERDRAGRAEKAFAMVLEAAFNSPGQAGADPIEDAEAAVGIIGQIRQIADDRGERVERLEAALRRIVDVYPQSPIYVGIAREALAAADTPQDAPA